MLERLRIHFAILDPPFSLPKLTVRPPRSDIPSKDPRLMMARARDNPYRTDRVLQVRYRFEQDDDWERLLQRLEDLRWRAAIVGPEGSGKTTLQEDLADRLAAAGRPIRWLRLNRDNRGTAAKQVCDVLRNPDSQTLVFVDGGEQLRPLLWWRLRRRSLRFGGLVITAHSPGRLPTLFECRSTLRTLEWIASRLAPSGQSPPPAALEDLFARHAGNLRLCLRELYDHWGSASEFAGAATPE